MSTNNSNGIAENTNTNQGAHDVKLSLEQDQPTSEKLQQVIIFLRKTEAAIEQYLNKKGSTADNDELQTTVKNLAIVLKSGDKDQSEYLLELMKKSNEKMMQLLSKLAFQLFKSKIVMYIQHEHNNHMDKNLMCF